MTGGLTEKIMRPGVIPIPMMTVRRWEKSSPGSVRIFWTWRTAVMATVATFSLVLKLIRLHLMKTAFTRVMATRAPSVWPRVQ